MKVKFLHLIFLLLASQLFAQNRTIGLLQYDSSATEGYTLFAPSVSTDVYLIDNCGELVHSWAGQNRTGHAAYLMDNGDILRAAQISNNIYTDGAGGGGLIERRDWNGNLVWYYPYSDIYYHQHHDIQPLPNGNILIVAWELRTNAEAVARGRNPALTSTDVWPEQIVEIQPIGTNSMAVVWEWHLWDHLIQDFDSTKLNYGPVGNHPELVDINFAAVNRADWIHANAVKYNADLDQIIISAHEFNEVWIIDHSTTTAEAAGHSGGRWGRGGDLLYRWGNPAAYRQGTASDQKLFGQHDSHWIPDSLNEGGKIMIYNNGLNRPGVPYSAVEILQPDTDSAGNYLLQNNRFGPDTVIYHYSDSGNFYSSGVSGAQRLAGGNTFICEGLSGRFFEINPQGQTIWQYKNPVTLYGPTTQGVQPLSNIVFRAHRMSSQHAGLAGRNLLPQGPIEVNPLPSLCLLSSIEEEQVLKTGPKLRQLGQEIALFDNDEALECNIQIFDIQGKEIQSFSTFEQNLHFRLDNLPKGLYLVRVNAVASNYYHVLKFIKE